MNRRTLAILMAAMLASRGVQAEENLLAYAGDEIVVTSSRVKQPKKELTSNITIITKEEISKSSANDLGELLAEKNLGHIQKYPGSSTSVGIRGFRTESHGNDLMGKVLVLLDGRRAGTGNLAKIMTANVERIEIIRGPAAVQYGSAAIGGVINVITAKGSGAPSASIEQELGSNDFSKTEATVQGKSGRFDYSGSVSKSDAGSYMTGSGAKYLNTRYSDQKIASMNVGYEIADNHRIGILFHSFDVDYAGSPSYLSDPDPDSYTAQNNHSVDFRYDGETSDRSFSWMARYFTGQDKYRYADPSSGYESTKDVDQQGAQAQVSWQPGALRLITGFDWLKYELDSTLKPNWASYENPAVFLLGKYSLFDESLILTAGVRYDDYRVKMKASEGESRSADNFAHQAGLAWQVSDFLKFRSSFAQGFRMPSERELAASIPDWYGNLYVGNPDLKPESSDTYEVGMDLSWKGVNGSLTWFSTDYTDMIEARVVDAKTYTYENIGSATVSGIEAELSKVFSIDGSSWTLEPYAGYTYLLRYRDNKSGDDLLFTPQWNASTGLRVHDGRGFNGAFNLAYTGKTFVQNYETGSGEVVPKGGFAVANLSASRKFPFEDKDINGPGITLKAEINNLFDRDYQYVTGYPMPGRTFVLGLRADI
ncbi:MAG: TonB-dependent receptor [Chlorobiaceae bacterium]|nr:TonB-dependent receptor [Chlorobiaceae bacterium]